MSEALVSIKESLEQALLHVTDLATFNQDTLIGVINILRGYLNDPAVSTQLKLFFALQVFPVLIQIMTMPLWKRYLSKIGTAGNLLLIYREFHFCSLTFPTLLKQAEYDEAIQKLKPSSKFPPDLQDLPNFFKETLLDELDRLVKLSESQRREQYRL